jgi:hypothetical protein
MNALYNITKETLLYTSVAIAGSIFIFKKIFGGKSRDKKFYDKYKRNLIKKSKLFFPENNPSKVEIKSEAMAEYSADNNPNNKFLKMKNFLQKISMKYDKVDNENKIVLSESSKNCQIKRNKKDEIFYYLLNNISQMMIVNNNPTNEEKKPVPAN